MGNGLSVNITSVEYVGREKSARDTSTIDTTKEEYRVVVNYEPYKYGKLSIDTEVYIKYEALFRFSSEEQGVMLDQVLPGFVLPRRSYR
jgi:hypothetical protein